MIRLSLAALLLSSAAALAAPQQSQHHPQPAPVAVASAAASTPVAPAATLPRKLQLRPEINLARDLVTFGDLIPGLASEAAATAAFREIGRVHV